MKTENTYVWSYIAGFIDGEGTISIRRQQGYKTKDGSFCFKLKPYIVITNTDVKAISWIREQLNRVGIHSGLSKRQPPTGKICYMLYVQKFSQIIEFLDLIQPFLIIKQENARVIRAFIALRQTKLKIKWTAPFGNKEKELANIVRLKKII